MSTAGRHDSERLFARMTLAYVGIGALGVAIGALRGHANVLVLPTRLHASSTSAHAISASIGIVVGVLVVVASRVLVRRAAWAAALHRDLRPFARAIDPPRLIPLAIASALAEEVLFRGALVPAIGVVGSSLLFGAMHQMAGRSRWTWVAFATVAGLVFSAIFVSTGSLLGAILAHAIVNAANLRFLRAHDPARGPALGGLLAQRPLRR